MKNIQILYKYKIDTTKNTMQSSNWPTTKSFLCHVASTIQILLKYFILTLQIQQIQIALCNTLPKTTLILKYYKNTVRIPHKTRSDTQACGHAEKEEVRTMSELAGITLEYRVLYQDREEEGDINEAAVVATSDLRSELDEQVKANRKHWTG